MTTAERHLSRTLVALSALAFPAGLFANLPFAAWPDGAVPMRLQLDAPGRPSLPSGGLADGSSNWNNAVIPALSAWNTHMLRSDFTHTTSTSTTVGQDNGVNNVFFSSNVYGEPFPSRVLAITLISRSGTRGVQITETDVVFNTAISWDSYRGTLRSRTDIRRVAMHEFGHAIGLGHPDEDSPPQFVPALMNSVISDVDGLLGDDIAGARVLYDTSTPVPSITRQPQSRTVAVGDAADMTVELDGAAPPQPSPTRQYAWFFTPTGQPEEFLFTIHEGVIPLGSAQLADRGTYRLVVETPQGSAETDTATLDVTPVATNPATRLANLSTRGIAGTGNRVLTVGFVIRDGARTVLLRGVGPTLAQPPFNVAGAVSNPRLVLNNSSVTLASNDNWGSGGGASEAQLRAAFQQAGAFDLPSGSADAALIATLQPGAYTALVEPVNGVEGLAIVEAYDLDLNVPGSPGRFVNLSTRGFVGTDSSILIGGFVVSGTGPRTYILRAVGDTLGTFGISGYLDDTLLTLIERGTGRRLRWTDDWDSPEFLQPQLQAAFVQVGATPLVDRQESALRLTLDPGVYSLQLSGFAASTGIALVEVYEE